jgi:hypothetical protein
MNHAKEVPFSEQFANLSRLSVARTSFSPIPHERQANKDRLTGFCVTRCVTPAMQNQRI